MSAGTIVFVHGMYVNALCWEHWVTRFRDRGYRCLAPDWPGRDQPIGILRGRHPDPELGRLTLGAVVEHFAKILADLQERPVHMGVFTTKWLQEHGAPPPAA